MIRKYRKSDLSSCAAVFCEAFGAEPWYEDWTQELAETRISELMGTPNSVGFVYVEDGEICGVMAGRVLTYLYGEEYMIDEFCVMPDLQRKGVGGKMLEHACKSLSSDGVVAIVLNTTKSFPAERFYNKNGFERVHGMIFMRKELEK